jgi:hypothetical protein
MVATAQKSICTQQIDKIDVSGQGGGEKILSETILKDWRRSSDRLYDFTLKTDNSLKLEIKKQHDGQWFNIANYHNISKDEENINMLFVMHTQGKIDGLYLMKLGDFINWMAINKSKDGWSHNHIKMAHDLKYNTKDDQGNPIETTLQLKAIARIRKIFENEMPKDIFTSIL